MDRVTPRPNKSSYARRFTLCFFSWYDSLIFYHVVSGRPQRLPRLKRSALDEMIRVVLSIFFIFSCTLSYSRDLYGFTPEWVADECDAIGIFRITSINFIYLPRKNGSNILYGSAEVSLRISKALKGEPPTDTKISYTITPTDSVENIFKQINDEHNLLVGFQVYTIGDAKSINPLHIINLTAPAHYFDHSLFSRTMSAYRDSGKVIAVLKARIGEKRSVSRREDLKKCRVRPPKGTEAYEMIASIRTFIMIPQDLHPETPNTAQ